MIRRSYSAFLAQVGCAAATLGCALAQSVPSAPYLSVPQRCAFLVSNPYVAKSLALSSAQSTAIQAALKRYDADAAQQAQLKEPSEKEIAANDTRFANSCLGALNPVQKDAVLKLGLQQIGTEGLLDSYVAAKLHLTPEQARRIAATYRAYEKKAEDVDAMEGEAIAAIPIPKAGADTTEYEAKKNQVFASYQAERDRLSRDKRESDKAILKMMNPTQRSEWLALTAVPPKKRR
ncbi:MAG: hypothetical protein P4L46_12445 [Fimbriimonas sp.]|nr:hypothetical protein [Fimbriimonas sp.]